MKLVKLTPNHPDIPKVKALYDTAFPASERFLTMDIIVSLLDQKPIELIGIYPDEKPDTFAGFFMMYKWLDFSYLCFFATCPEMRSKGIGSKAIQALKQYYGSVPVVFAYESVFEECDNMEQRERRRSFYLKNGFYETGWLIRSNGVELIIASSIEKFDIDSYRAMLDTWMKDAPASSEKPKLLRREE